MINLSTSIKATSWNRVIMSGLLLILMLTGCLAGPPSAAPVVSTSQASVTLRISGAGGTTIILEAVQPAFELTRPDYRLEVLAGTGTSGGVKGVMQGVLDVAAMSRPPTEEEVAQNLAYTQFGQAGQAIITHLDVGVTNLTKAQIKAIFTGRVSNWTEVGGPNLPLILYVRDEDDTSTKVLRQFVVGDTPFPETMAQVLTSQGDMLTAVAGTPGSIGIVNWPAAVAKQAKVQAVTLDGLAPNSSTYPMLSQYGLGYLDKRQAEIQPLIDWLKSESGRAALQKFQVITAP
ncbi:MAG: substrate-binding domain-containing protein [Anaerolineae bacterium]